MSGKDLIGFQVTISNMPAFTITGVTDQQAPNIYVDRDMMMNIIANSSPEKVVKCPRVPV